MDREGTDILMAFSQHLGMNVFEGTEYYVIHNGKPLLCVFEKESQKSEIETGIVFFDQESCQEFIDNKCL